MSPRIGLSRDGLWYTSQSTCEHCEHHDSDPQTPPFPGGRWARILRGLATYPQATKALPLLSMQKSRRAVLFYGTPASSQGPECPDPLIELKLRCQIRTHGSTRRGVRASQIGRERARHDDPRLSLDRVSSLMRAGAPLWKTHACGRGSFTKSRAADRAACSGERPISPRDALQSRRPGRDRTPDAP